MDRRQAFQAFQDTRQASLALCNPLQDEDWAGSLPDAQSPKWYLGETTWQLENKILKQLIPGYHELDRRYGTLFRDKVINAFSRPSQADIMGYRDAIDLRILKLLDDCPEHNWPTLSTRLQNAIDYEHQQQEHMLLDIKWTFANNPTQPIFNPDIAKPSSLPVGPQSTAYFNVESGTKTLLNDHIYLPGFDAKQETVTNAEYLTFMAENGYERADFWSDEGWQVKKRLGWTSPLYWHRIEDQNYAMTLGGLRPLALQEPVCHISYYEAEAYACWADMRLLNEREWEALALSLKDPNIANSLSSHQLHPIPAARGTPTHSGHLLGNVWEWTSSPMQGYGSGALRGGSCYTAKTRIQATLRQFTTPENRRFCSGLRLAKKGVQP